MAASASRSARVKGKAPNVAAKERAKKGRYTSPANWFAPRTSLTRDDRTIATSMPNIAARGATRKSITPGTGKVVVAGNFEGQVVSGPHEG
jgi:hypothetical protein